MIKIEELQSVLGTVTIDPKTREEIIKKAEELEAEKKADKVTAPKTKSEKQWVVVLKSPATIDPNTVAHLFQLDGEDDAGTIVTKIQEAAVNHNLATRKKSNLVESFDDVVHIKRKPLKDKNVALKTKEDWCRVVQLPENVKFGGFEKGREATTE